MNATATVPRPALLTIDVPVQAETLERCAWCDEADGIKFTGNVTHRICPRHLVSNLVFSRQHHSFEALYYTLLCIIAEGKQ